MKTEVTYRFAIGDRHYRIEHKGCVFICYCDDLYIGLRRTLEDARILCTLHDGARANV